MRARKLLVVACFLVGLVLLQQGIERGIMGNEGLSAHYQVVADHDIDPAALFYTESRLALAAEKEVRRRMNRSP